MDRLILVIMFSIFGLALLAIGFLLGRENWKYYRQHGSTPQPYQEDMEALGLFLPPIIMLFGSVCIYGAIWIIRN